MPYISLYISPYISPIYPLYILYISSIYPLGCKVAIPSRHILVVMPLSSHPGLGLGLAWARARLGPGPSVHAIDGPDYCTSMG